MYFKPFKLILTLYSDISISLELKEKRCDAFYFFACFGIFCYLCQACTDAEAYCNNLYLDKRDKSQITYKQCYAKPCLDCSVTYFKHMEKHPMQK